MGCCAGCLTLTRWASIAAQFLKPGGTFYIIEEHPIANIFENAADAKDLRLTYPYFHSPEPVESVTQGSYADREAHVSQPVSYQWHHHLAEILTAIISAGLRIEFLHEFPYCNYAKLLFIQRGEDGWWRLPDANSSIPFLFSLKAMKEPRRG